MYLHLAKIQNGVIVEYPLSEESLTTAIPNYSELTEEPNWESVGLAKVVIPPSNIVDGYNYVPKDPQLVDGKWVASLVKDEETPAELIQLRTQNAAVSKRADRDFLLKEAQSRVDRYNRLARLGKPQIDNIDELDTYIQALADLPEKEGFPFTVIFPTKP